MGIKEDKLGESKEFSLSDLDVKFITALNQGGIASYNYYRSLVQTYLAMMAGSKWGYPADATLDFEIDPEHKKVKVTPSQKPLT